MTKSKQVVEWCRANPEATTADLMDRFSVSRQAVHQALSRAGLRAAPAHQPRIRDYAAPPPRFKIALPSNVTGALAELLVCTDLLERGLDVYRSITPSGRCDLVTVCRSTGETNRVEVKCGRMSRSGKVVCNPGPHNSFDTLAIVIGNSEIIYDPPMAYP